MGNIQFLGIVSNSLIQDKQLAEENLEKLVMDNNMESKEKLAKIKEAIMEYGESVNAIAYWESYVKENITIPGQNQGVQPPAGDNNN